MKKIELLNKATAENIITIEHFRNIDNEMFDRGYYSREDDISSSEIESRKIYYTSRITNEISAVVEFTSADICEATNDSLLYNVTIRMNDEPEIKQYNETLNLTDELAETISSYMNDEIREELHNEIAPCTFNKFLKEYCDRDLDFEDLLENEFTITIC